MAEEETAHPIIHATTAHEVGVLVGFAAIMVIATVIFFIAWRLYNKRQEKIEAERKAGLLERGFGELEKGEVRGEGLKNGKGVGREQRNVEHSIGGDGSGVRAVGRVDGNH